MSQTTNSQLPTQSTIVFFDGSQYQLIARGIRDNHIANGLLAGLYGVLVVLSVQAVRALRQKTQPAASILTLTIVALFTSTMLYIVASFVSIEQSYLANLLNSSTLLWTYFPAPESDLSSEQPVLDSFQKEYTWLSNRDDIYTATIMINVILGDAIVCWRACVIWHRNHVIPAVCCIFLLATLVLGILDVTLGNHYLPVRAWQDSEEAIGFLTNEPGALFENNSFGISTCVLSLTTNIVSTLLIAYKAWVSRKRLRKYLVLKTGGSPTAKLFAILIESGVIYCGIWSLVVAYQISNYNFNRNLGPMSKTKLASMEVFGIIMNGAIVPVITIYPVIIIVLVASNQSHVEKALTQIQYMPTPVVMVDTITVTGHSESMPSRLSSGLLCNQSQQESQDCQDIMENTVTNMREE
ncbi:hypothetical protein V8D89_009845 [Ganoderma adspersum]